MRLNLLSVVLCMLCMNWTYAQTTISTNHTNNNGASSITFYVQNTNAFDIIITGVSTHLGTNAANNIQLLYNTVPYNDLTTPWSFGTVGAGQNGWVSAGTSVVASNTANGVVPALTGLSLTVPAGATYQLGLSANTIQYMTLTNGGGANINTFSGGGVNLKTGDGISWGGGTYPSTPVNYPRGFIGSITFVPAVPCTAPPTTGTVSAASNPICPSINNTLSIVGGTGGTGQTYQWQSSTNGTTFTNIVGAVGSTYTANQATAMYYRYYTTCSGMTDTSAATLVAMNPFYNCYCTSAATNTGDEEIFSVTLNGASTASSYSGSNGCTTVAPGPGSILSRYSNFKTLGALTSMYFGQTANFTIEEDECDGATYFACGIAVWVDFNQNGIFTDAGEQVYVENATATGPRLATGSFAIPLTATGGLTAMRIVCAEGLSGASLTPCGTYGYGETEDFLVEIRDIPNVSLDEVLALQANYCNSPVNVDLVVRNLSGYPELDVPWAVTSMGMVITNGSVPYLAPFASDTISVTLGGVGPLGTNAMFKAYTYLLGDQTVSDDTLTVNMGMSFTGINASMVSPVGCTGSTNGAIVANGHSGISPYTYVWNNGQTTNMATGLSGGSYTVTVNDATGCAATVLLTLTDPAVLSLADTVTNLNCNGNNSGWAMVMPMGGVANYSYLWSNGQATSQLTNVAAGTYTVTVTDASGCTTSSSVVISEPSVVDGMITDNMNGTATASATGGNAPYTYQWDAAAGNQTTETATGLPSGGVYYVVITDANGCTDVVTIQTIMVGVENIATIANLNLFPNPTNGNVFVELNLTTATEVQVAISNVTGQTVLAQNLGTTISDKIELETATLPTGVYMVQFNIGNEQITKKLVVTK